MAASVTNSSSKNIYRAQWFPVLWLSVSTIIVFWDAGFCLLRPRSMVGGDLQWIWTPYSLYELTDLVYGPAIFKAKDGFTAAQAILNLFENAFNIGFLLLARAGKPIAPLVGFFGVTCTLWKTVLYWLMDYMCGPNGWCQTGHNTTRNWWLLFALPNGLWILIPAILVILFGSEIAASLYAAPPAGARSLTSSQKKRL